MNVQVGAVPAALLTPLHSICTRVSTYVRQRRRLVLVVWVLAYLLYYAVADSLRPMWTDEFYTYYISRLGLREMWSALLTGADQHPPLFYAITHLSLSVFGFSHLSLRLPATLGFLLMCLCVYRFASKRSAPVPSLIAMCFPLVTGASYYAQEARGYGMALGFAALALVSWQTAADREHRVVAVPLLALSLVLAVGSHYYALMFGAALVAGELVRTLSRRAFDVPVCIALSAVAVPVIAFLPVIQSARSYGATFWAVPTWDAALGFYNILLSRALFPLVLTLGLIAAYSAREVLSRRSHPAGERGLMSHELAAALAMLALPLLTVMFAKAFTAGFHFRYVLYVVIGFSILLSHILTVFSDSEEMVAGALFVSLLAWCGGQFLTRLPSALTQPHTEHAFLANAARPDLPIVLSDTYMLFQMNHYAPDNIAHRLKYLADPKASLKYLGHDTMDRGLLDLQPWFPVPVQSYCSFVATNQEFLAYGPMDGEWNWLVYAMAADRMHTQVLGIRNKRVLLLVKPDGGSENCRTGVYGWHGRETQASAIGVFPNVSR